MATYATKLAEQLTSMVDRVPDAVDVVQLTQPDVRTVLKRLARLIASFAEAAGLEGGRPKVETGRARTVMQLPGQLRATAFHASGAMSVKLDLAPFDGIFDEDPGDDSLVSHCQRAADRLGFPELVPEDDSLTFEHLWRIKAAGGDPKGATTAPVLCRAIGAFRHETRGLPVYGRASATVELAAGSRPTSASMSLRRLAGDDGGEIVASAKTRSPQAAAEEVAARLVQAFGGLDDLKATELVPEWFRFGYLSFSRRQTQGLLAPFYIASVGVVREQEASAHVVAVSGSEEQFVRQPTGRRSSAPTRQAARV